MGVYVRLCLFMSVYVRFSPFMSVYVDFVLFMSVSVRFCPILFAYVFLDATALSCNAKLSGSLARWLAGSLADTF